jgi:hypothetical protein
VEPEAPQLAGVADVVQHGRRDQQPPLVDRDRESHLRCHFPGSPDVRQPHRVEQLLDATVLTKFHQPSAMDAPRRITAFFQQHLGDGSPPSG